VALTDRIRFTLLVTVGALAGCSSPAPSAPASVGASAPAPSASAIAAPSPGRPFQADAILVGMRESRRPDGVPDELETNAIAAAVAEQIWTFDGEPWVELVIGGSCGPESCTLDVSGAPTGSLGDDVYAFQIDPAASRVDLLDATLQGVPAALGPQLDALARASRPDLLDEGGSRLTTIRWQPPPNESRFLLSYRSGGEEGTPQVDLSVDVVTSEVDVLP
jgi:hypothetical protein